MHAVFMEAQRGDEFLETEVIGGCELLCGWWESNPGLVQDQPVLFAAEPTLSQFSPTCSQF